MVPNEVIGKDERETLILNILHPNDGMSTDEIAAAINTNYNTTYRTLELLRQKNKITKKPYKDGKRHLWILGEGKPLIINFSSLDTVINGTVTIWELAKLSKHKEFSLKASRLWNQFPLHVVELYKFLIRLENKQLVSPKQLRDIKKDLQETRAQLNNAVVALDRLLAHPFWEDLKLLKGALTGSETNVTIEKIKELLAILEAQK